ncbi:hypothetical protein ASF71_19290 [Deinococcus sp. Leaf326]|nr:hypothetical protein ASF71_19290 [Deinococcus sp. Leaf326]
MTAPPLTFWQARVLLLMTLETQSVNDVAVRIALRGAMLDLSRVQELLRELTALGLLEYTPKRGHAAGRYQLGSGSVVEDALDQADVIVRGNRPHSTRQK